MGFEGLNRSIPKAAADASYTNADNGEQLLTADVAASHNFRDLITNVIMRYDDWKYSNGDRLDKTELVGLIRDVQNGLKTPDYITSRYGLRAKVVELLASE